MATAHLLERQDAVKTLERQLLSALTIARLTEVKVTTDDGRYQFQAMLGRGASGIVCKALDTRMERLVALKLYPGIADEIHAASVRNEAKRLARPSHRNIVFVHDYNAALLRPGEIRCFYVAMELLPGLSLRHWLAQARTADAIVEVFCRAGEGLAAAHAAGVIHRDFKPENVMLVGDEPKIVDFGLAIDEPIAAAALSSKDPQQRTIVGTLAYMAPETLEGRAEARSDQFAFAAALWEALYREFPYPVDSVDPADRRHIRPPPKAAEYPAALLRCLTRALSGDPRRRYPDMNQLVSQLRDLQGELRSLTTSASMSSVVLAEQTTREQVRMAPKPSRAPWLALPFVGIAAIAGILGQAGFWNDPGPAGAESPTEGEQGDEDPPDRLLDRASVAAPAPPPAPASPSPPERAMACANESGWAGKWAFEAKAHQDSDPKGVGLVGEYELQVRVKPERCELEIELTKRAIRTSTKTQKVSLRARTTVTLAKIEAQDALVLSSITPSLDKEKGAFVYDLVLFRAGDELAGDFHGMSRDGKRTYSGSLSGWRRGTVPGQASALCDEALARKVAGRWTFKANDGQKKRTYDLVLTAKGCVLATRGGSGVAYGDGLWRLHIDEGGYHREWTLVGATAPKGTFTSSRGAPRVIAAHGTLSAVRPP